MNINDPATWPKQPYLAYWRLSRALPVAHAFYGGTGTTLCNVSLARDKRVIPTKGYTRLCKRCIGALKSWGYLSGSEVVESS